MLSLRSQALPFLVTLDQYDRCHLRGSSNPWPQQPRPLRPARGGTLRTLQIRAQPSSAGSRTGLPASSDEVEHTESNVLEDLLRGAELAIIVWAAAPHVLSAVSHMRVVTQQLSSEAQHGVQRPARVQQLLLHALQWHEAHKRAIICMHAADVEVFESAYRTCGSS